LIEEGLEHFKVTGVRGGVGLALKAEILHLAHRISEALQVIREAQVLAERQAGALVVCGTAGVFLASIGADEAEIGAAFRSVISTARNRIRFRSKDARKRPTRDTITQRRKRIENTVFNCLFAKRGEDLLKPLTSHSDK
jgi:hypothetical protein